MTFDALWGELGGVGLTLVGRLPPLRLDRAGRDAARVVRRRRPQPAGWTSSLDRAGNQWAWWGDPDATRPGRRRSAATWTRCPTAARSTARSASCRPSPRSTRCAPTASHRPVRSASSTSATRRAPGSASPAPGRGCSPARWPPTGRRALTRRRRRRRWPRRCRGRAATRPRSAATTRRCAGSARSSSCTSSRAAAWSTSTRRSAVASAIWPHGRWRSTCPARPTTPARPGWPTARDPMLALRPPSCWPRASRRAARRGGHLRQGARRAERRQRDPVARHGLARRPRAAPRRRARGRRRARRRSRPSGGRSPRSRGPTRRRSTPACARRLAALLGDAAGAGHRRRPRRRHPRRGRHPDRDAVRAQPDRGLALAGRVRRARRLPGRRRGADRGAGRRRWRGVTAYWSPSYAWLPDGPSPRVRFDGRRRAVRRRRRRRAARPDDAPPARRSSLPGFANTHSHAFHRALRGRTHDGGGTFWTWREQMYAVAARLDPDSYLALAPRDVRRDGAGRGHRVGEFHYLHHAPGGRRYADPNAMGEALLQAAARGRHPDHAARHLLPRRRSGRRRATCRSTSVQRRFADGDARALGRAGRPRLSDAGHARIGAAIHSVRAVPRDAAGRRWPPRPGAAARPPVRAAGRERAVPSRSTAAPPTRLLADAGRARAGDDRGARHPSRPPTTSRCSGDPAPRSASARPPSATWPTASVRPASWPTPGHRSCSAPTSTPSRPARGGAGRRVARAAGQRQRGRFSPAELVRALTVDGHAASAGPTPGSSRSGRGPTWSRCGWTRPRTAGADPAQVVFAATAADVDTVHRRRPGRRRRTVGTCWATSARCCAAAIEPLWR